MYPYKHEARALGLVEISKVTVRLLAGTDKKITSGYVVKGKLYVGECPDNTTKQLFFMEYRVTAKTKRLIRRRKNWLYGRESTK